MSYRALHKVTVEPSSLVAIGKLDAAFADASHVALGWSAAEPVVEYVYVFGQHELGLQKSNMFWPPTSLSNYSGAFVGTLKWSTWAHTWWGIVREYPYLNLAYATMPDMVEFICAAPPAEGPYGSDVTLGVYKTVAPTPPLNGQWGTPGPATLVSDLLPGPFPDGEGFIFTLDPAKLTLGEVNYFEIASDDEVTEPTDDTSRCACVQTMAFRLTWN